jgi:hypothetical protein
MADIGSSEVEVSTSVFSVVYFSIDVATRELSIANTSSGRRKIRHFCHRGFGKLAGLIAPRGDTQVLKDSGLMALECSVGVDHAGFAFNAEFLGHMLNARWRDIPFRSARSSPVDCAGEGMTPNGPADRSPFGRLLSMLASGLSKS